MTHTDDASISPSGLQEAVDAIERRQVVGAPAEPVIILGVDVIPGIVVTQPNGKLEAPAVVYLEVGASSNSHSSSRRAKVEFHLANEQIVIDRVVLA